MVSKASEDLPEPETPVTTVMALCGTSKSMFLRLCTRAPRTTMLSLGEMDILETQPFPQGYCPTGIPRVVAESFYYTITEGFGGLQWRSRDMKAGRLANRSFNWKNAGLCIAFCASATSSTMAALISGKIRPLKIGTGNSRVQVRSPSIC